MKKYYVRVNCPAFTDYIVTASSAEEAEDLAENSYNCQTSGGEIAEPARFARKDDTGTEIESWE